MQDPRYAQHRLSGIRKFNYNPADLHFSVAQHCNITSPKQCHRDPLSRYMLSVSMQRGLWKGHRRSAPSEREVSEQLSVLRPAAFFFRPATPGEHCVQASYLLRALERERPTCKFASRLTHFSRNISVLSSVILRLISEQARERARLRCLLMSL